jgi:hypothetical protein
VLVRSQEVLGLRRRLLPKTPKLAVLRDALAHRLAVKKTLTWEASN